MTPSLAFVVPGVPETLSSSQRLAKDAAAGDTMAMRTLLRHVGPRIVRVVRAVLGRAHPDVEDVAQQAMLGFVQALPSFRRECEPEHFASRVAARAAIAAAKRARQARARRDNDVDLDSLPSRITDEDDDRGVRGAILRDALACIPAEQAETLALRIVLGWSLAEVAEATGVPLNTVRSRMRLAKTALRNLLHSHPAAHEALGFGDESF